MKPDPHRFFDGGSLDGTEMPNPKRDMEVRLDRVVEPAEVRLLWWRRTVPTELFKLERRIAYHAHGFDEPHVVPADETFRTDLTSVPWLFTWLVPRTGCHLPAALVHDGLVEDKGKPRSYCGPEVDRARADEIFRDAMADLGTGMVRRWITWTAVTLATVGKGVGEEWWDRAAYRLNVFGSLLLICCLGVLATIDLFDVGGATLLPWMGEQGWLAELGYGALAAVLIPLLLAPTWRRFWKAGAIAGVALALLFHVTIVLFGLTLLFQALEFVLKWLGARRRRTAIAAPRAASA